MNCTSLANLIRFRPLPVFSMAVCINMVILLSEPTSAQAVTSMQESVQTASTSDKFGRNAPVIAAALKPLVNLHSASVVQISGDQGQTQLGTIVTSDGLIVAKLSEIPESISCRLPNGDVHPATLIGQDTRRDLALIQVSATGLSPIKMHPTFPIAGTLLVSVGPGEETLSFGISTIAPQSFKDQENSQEQQKKPAKLGIWLLGTVETEPRDAIAQPQLHPVYTGLRIGRVYPRTTAEDCGLLVGDLLHSFNGTELENIEQLKQLVNQLKVDEPLELQIIRDGKIRDLKTRFKPSSARTPHDLWGGGPFSNRRFGFGTVIAHDGIIDPKHCGGPLVDLQGRVVGINIARSMRSATFAIPSKDVIEFIRFVRPDAKLELDER